MIIYNKTWLNNLHLHDQAQELFDAGCINTEELKSIVEKHPVELYTPGPIIRSGLFVLTCITVLFSFGLLTLLLTDAHVANSFGWPLFLGLVCGLILELMTVEKRYYRAGVNDALMWMSAIFIAGAFWWMLEPAGYSNVDADYLQVSLFILAISTYFTLRYADVLMSAVTCLAIFAVVFFAWQKTGQFGNATMPFLIILTAAALYLRSLKLARKIKINYYNQSIVTAQVVCLLVLYVAGNYWVIDQMNHQLNNIASSIQVAVKWGLFFWAWTMLIPVIYVASGIIKKNVTLLRVGLMLTGAAICTFRTYYHVMTIELAFIIGGILLLTLVYLIVRYLKTPKHGFTYADINGNNSADNIKLESLLTVATFNHTSSAPAKTADRFGGGDFGGGGSGGGF